MKKLNGVAHNIETLLIGKITTKEKMLISKKDLIYVNTDGKFPGGYKAVITSSSGTSNNSANYVNKVASISLLHDNDIVIIEPNGKISIVYDINSKHNAIFITERCNSNCIMSISDKVVLRHIWGRTKSYKNIAQIFDNQINMFIISW